MKTRFMLWRAMGFSAIAACSFVNLHAQWQLTGNAATPTDWLGTSNTNPLVIKTNNAERMRIDGTGKVGIGTTAPLADLHITKTGTGGFGTNASLKLEAINVSPATNVTYDFKAASTGSFFLTQYISGASTPVLAVNPAGWVSIGTQNSANAKLDVRNNMRVTSLTNSAKYVEISHDATNAFIDGPNELRINYNSGANVMIGKVGFGTSNLFVAGKIGIGTATPAASLDVAGNARIINTPLSTPGGYSLSIESGVRNGLEIRASQAVGTYGYGLMVNTTQPTTKALAVQFEPTPSSFTETFRVYTNGNTFISGNVGIGKFEDAGYALDVAGTIRACEVLVEANGWCDYVFEDDYKLRPIDELNTYLKDNKHLPNIPSAAEVEANGQNLAEYQKLMMEKIEELSLYVIELHDRVKTLESENATLRSGEQK